MKNTFRSLVGSLQALWRTFPRQAHILFIIAVVIAVAIPIFSADRAFWAVICLGGLILSILSGLLIVRILKQIK
jgi:hypothetical protein